MAQDFVSFQRLSVAVENLRQIIMNIIHPSALDAADMVVVIHDAVVPSLLCSVVELLD